jgi:hypothetical protein
VIEQPFTVYDEQNEQAGSVVGLLTVAAHIPAWEVNRVPPSERYTHILRVSASDTLVGANCRVTCGGRQWDVLGRYEVGQPIDPATKRWKLKEGFIVNADEGEG